MIRGKRAIGVRAIEVLLYSVHSLSQTLRMTQTNTKVKLNTRQY